MLYGDAARGEFIQQSSDVNVMLIFKVINVDLLDRIAPAIEQAKREINLEAMLLDEMDLPTCAEVFPIKFRDIQRNHKLLHGAELVEQMEMSTERLKRQCQREIQNLQLRMRRFYLDRKRWPERIEGTLEDLVSKFLLDLAVVVELKTGNVSASKNRTIDEAEKLGLKCKVLRDLMQLKRGELAPKADALKGMYGDFMTAVDQTERLLEKI